MSTNQRKSQQRSAATARQRHIAFQLRINLEALDRTDTMPRAAANLAKELVSIVAWWRAHTNDDANAKAGALMAAYLTALDCRSTRKEWAAQLQCMAANLLKR